MVTVKRAAGPLGRTRHAHATVGQVLSHAGLVGSARFKKLLKALHGNFVRLEQGKRVDGFFTGENRLAVPLAVNESQSVSDLLDTMLVFADVRDCAETQTAQRNMELRSGLPRPVEQVSDEVALRNFRARGHVLQGLKDALVRRNASNVKAHANNETRQPTLIDAGESVSLNDYLGTWGNLFLKGSPLPLLRVIHRRPTITKLLT